MSLLRLFLRRGLSVGWSSRRLVAWLDVRGRFIGDFARNRFLGLDRGGSHRGRK
jgi:hypothetical protein